MRDLMELHNVCKEVLLNPEKAEDLTKHILDSRQEQVKETIKRKINN